jgi:CRP-like cAMP-binding protein
MNPDERSTLATVMEPRQFLEGDKIITQGAQGDCLYIMAMGKAYVTLTFQP